VVTHAMQSPGELSLDDIKRCVENGAFIEHCYSSYLMGSQASLAWMRDRKHISMVDFANAINAVGAEHCVIATSLEPYMNPTPPDSLKEFIRALRSQGITDGQIDLMARKNPVQLLGL
jgi:hypothetical protein